MITFSTKNIVEESSRSFEAQSIDAFDVYPFAVISQKDSLFQSGRHNITIVLATSLLHSDTLAEQNEF